MSDQFMTRGGPRVPGSRSNQQSGGPFGWLQRVEFDAGGDNSDLAHGQAVIVAARWILVAAGLVLALWNPAAIGPLRLQVLVLLMIAVANFFLHAQLLRKRDTVTHSAYFASGADLAVITILVASQGGFDSNLFVFYFPAMLALSVAFRPELTALYGGATLAVYGLIAMESLEFEATSDQIQTLFVRLLMIAGVAVCGALYQRVERDRRAGGAMPQSRADEPLVS